MDVVKEDLRANRRSFLQGMGLSAFALTSLAPFSRLPPRAWAAVKPSRFVYAWTAFDLLDPYVKYDGNAYFFNLNTYDTLLRYQGSPRQIVPWLAERYEVTDGGRTWTFHLRQGVQFHDGSELTPEAVRFSFERLLTIGKAPAGSFKRMGLTSDRVRALHPYTVEITLDKPYGPFRAAIPIVSIVNSALIKAHDNEGSDQLHVRPGKGQGAPGAGAGEDHTSA
jgi:peptide/nickel transport system substrate-binding protein